MPLPTPQPQEEKSAFVARCIADRNSRAEFPDMVQRIAVCINQYEKQ
jgi:hypothetical protein